MAAKQPQNPHVQMAEPARKPGPEQAKRNLTRERMKRFLAAKKAKAELMEKPPKNLVSMDPEARANEMVPGKDAKAEDPKAAVDPKS